MTASPTPIPAVNSSTDRQEFTQIVDDAAASSQWLRLTFDNRRVDLQALASLIGLNGAHSIHIHSGLEDIHQAKRRNGRWPNSNRQVTIRPVFTGQHDRGIFIQDILTSVTRLEVL